MNFIFISPQFPHTYWEFCRRLKQNGITVLGIGDAPYESLSNELKGSLDDWYFVPDMEDYGRMYRAVAFLASKWGRIDWIESNNEYWLAQDARLRTDFNVRTGIQTDHIDAIKEKSEMKRYYALAGVPSARQIRAAEGEEAVRAFAGKTGYPVFAKPDIGVGANGTYKINDSGDLSAFFRDEKEWRHYVVEEFVQGDIASYDAIVGRGDFDVNGTAIENGLHAVMITESGHIWDFYFNMEGSLYRVDSNKSIDLSLEGVSDPTNETGASLFYDEQTEFMYLSLYNGADDNAHLYAIDFNDPARLAEVGTFNEKVWPVVGLHQYTPATDLVLKVEPDEISMFEGETAELKIKVKLGETNEYDVAIADETVASYADGIVTGLKEGETTITVTTKDTNDAGETLSKEIPVTVKGLTHLDSSVVAQVTDDNGANFVTLNLNNLSTMTKAAAPGNVTSGARTGDIYMAGVGTSISAVDAEDLTTPAAYEFDSFYAQYPAQDIANYPIFKDEEGELDEHKALFTTNLGWLVTPDYYGWNLSSYLPDMAGICFGGTDEDEDGAPIYVYYLLTTAGILYEVDVSYSSGSLAYQSMIDTGIKLENQSDASMAYIYDVKLNPDYTIAPKNVGIVIADNGTKKLWFVDFQTAEIGLIGTIDATNISGLVGTFDTLATVVTDDGDAAASELNRVGDGLAFMSKTTKENGIDTIFERAKVGETTNATVGGTNAIKVSKLGKTPVIGRDSVISGSEGDASVTLTSDEPIANGLFQIKYDTEALTFVGAESDAKIFSVNEKDGVITFAFAAIEPFAADATIATLKFTYANDYVDTTVTVTTLERNDDTAVEEEPEELALTQEDGDHNWVEDTEARVEPTCTATGLATYKCTKCGDVKVETLDALDHDWNEGEITTAATCTEDGVKTFTCARCGETRTEAISAPGHTPVDVEAVAPTCTEAGATAGKKCSVCGAILEGIEIVLPTGHTIEVIPAIPATCTEGGMTAGAKCSVCGEILVAPTATEKLGHTPEEIPAVPATCTEAGLTAGSKCAVCGEILDAPKPVEALGHAWLAPKPSPPRATLPLTLRLSSPPAPPPARPPVRSAPSAARSSRALRTFPPRATPWSLTRPLRPR